MEAWVSLKEIIDFNILIIANLATLKINNSPRVHSTPIMINIWLNYPNRLRKLKIQLLAVPICPSINVHLKIQSHQT